MSRSHTQPPQHRPPRQARSRRTYQRIIAATERLLEESLFDDISIQQIIEEAGVSTGSFYARFASKDAMIPALVDRYFETLAVSSLEVYSLVSPGAGLEARVRALVTERVSRFRRWKGLLRSLVMIERIRPQTTHGLVQQHAAVAGRALLDFMSPALEEIAHPDPALAVERAFYFISAICRERILFPETPHASEVDLADDELIGELSSMMLGYLGTGPPAGQSPPDAAD